MMTKRSEPVVHIVDDDAAVRDSLRLLLYSVGIETATYVSAADFLARCDRERPGCLIADVRMPGMSGLDLQRELARLHVPLPVIVITAHGDTPMAVGALKAGACDFIEKPYDDQHLIDSVRQAIDRGARLWRDHERIAQARADYESLTAREREVMARVVAGESSKVIAGHLGISPRTVEIHRARTMEKVHARGLADLVRMAQLLETADE
jgi:two-component system response regulator FixJ